MTQEERNMVWMMIVDLKWRLAENRCGCGIEDCVDCDNDDDTKRIIERAEKLWPDISKYRSQQ